MNAATWDLLVIVAAVYVAAWIIDAAVWHVRGGEPGREAVTGADLANEGEATRDTIGDVLGVLDEVLTVLQDIRDAPELEARAERDRAKTFRASG